MAEEAATQESIGLMRAKAGKYLTFSLKNEEYGFEILKVKEIIGLMNITPVPQTPNFVKGVINLRGKVIPVVDLRSKFEMEEVEHTSETCVIVVDINNVLCGIIVDSVSEVLDTTDKDLEPAPDFGKSVDTSYILGLAKGKEKVKILLDIDKVLTDQDIDIITETN